MRINLAQTKSMKRYLVYTTDDSRTRPFDPTRFLASATPQNRRFRPPVGKVRLAAKSPVSGEECRTPRTEGRDFWGESPLDEFSISEIWGGERGSIYARLHVPPPRRSTPRAGACADCCMGSPSC